MGRASARRLFNAPMAGVSAKAMPDPAAASKADCIKPRRGSILVCVIWLSRRYRHALPDNGFAEALHFFKLRAELQQQKIHAHTFELGNLFLNLDGPAHQAR